MKNKEQPKISPETSLERKERGRNIHLKVSFHRHAERTPEGQLSEMGLAHAKKVGKERTISKDGIKIYTSPFKRARDTVEQIIKGVKEQNKKQKVFTTRARLELAPPEWEYFDILRERVREVEAKKGQNGMFRYILSEPLAQKDIERWTSGLAYLVNRYRRMTDKLYSNSNVELLHITHDIVIGDFLRKVAILKDKKGERIDLNNLDAIGGPVKPLEGFNFEIYSDEKGEKRNKIIFRGKELEIDEEKLKELVGKFKEEPYRGRTTKQDYKQKT